MNSARTIGKPSNGETRPRRGCMRNRRVPLRFAKQRAGERAQQGEEKEFYQDLRNVAPSLCSAGRCTLATYRCHRRPNGAYRDGYAGARFSGLCGKHKSSRPDSERRRASLLRPVVGATVSPSPLRFSSIRFGHKTAGVHCWTVSSPASACSSLLAAQTFYHLRFRTCKVIPNVQN